MKTANFKDWTLTTLDLAFGLEQVWEMKWLAQWQHRAAGMAVSETERQQLLDLQAPLIWGGKAWNEVELENKFISPLLMQVKIDDRTIGYFLDRGLKGVVGEYELSGIVDGMIATGFRDPQRPFFCMHEYKKSIENQGSPDAQVLAAMLLIREMNGYNLPVYGLYVVGLTWNFMVLHANHYCISQDYKAGDEDVFTIFRMLKALKAIIKEDLLPAFQAGGSALRLTTF